MADVTKERILEAATIIIRDSGPERLTVEAAADLAGVSRKTVYNHFNGKYALITDATEAWTSRMLSALKEIADNEALPFVPKLNAIVEHAYTELKHAGRMIQGAGPTTSLVVPGLKLALQRELYSFIVEIVQKALDEGLVRREFSARRLTYAILNVVTGLTALEAVEGEPLSKVEVLKDSLKALVGGILTPSGVELMRGSPLFE